MSGQGTRGRHRRTFGKAFASLLGGACASAITSTVLVLCIGIVAGATTPARAGQARAQFKASLRIDAGLVERDLAVAPAGKAAAATSATTSASTLAEVAGSASASSATRLPRANGSGWCVRVAISTTRFRWQCD